MDAMLGQAFSHPDPAKQLARQLDKSYPGAGASLPRSSRSSRRCFTVTRLGIDGRLAKTLTTSNPVKTMISIGRATNRSVTRCRDGL